MRYKGGATSYLEVLDSDTRQFAAQLTLAQAQVDDPAPPPGRQCPVTPRVFVTRGERVALMEVLSRRTQGCPSLGRNAARSADEFHGLSSLSRDQLEFTFG